MARTRNGGAREQPKRHLLFQTTSIFGNIGLWFDVVIAARRFGSISTALGYAETDHLLPDSKSESFGNVEAKGKAEVCFDLKNCAGGADHGSRRAFVLHLHHRGKPRVDDYFSSKSPFDGWPRPRRRVRSRFIVNPPRHE